MEEIRRFVEASEGLQFQGRHRAEVYGWMEQVAGGQQYATQGKAARGLLRRYMEKMTGLSRAQVTRLITRYMALGRVPAYPLSAASLPGALHARRRELLAAGRRGA